MPDQAILDVAKQIADKTFFEQGWHFGVASLFTIVATAGAAYLGAYSKKRGETYALHADFTELSRQLRLNTETTELIRLSLSHDDWTRKEWMALRRTKLEELMTEIYAAEIWREGLTNSIFDLEADTNLPVSINRMKMLGHLYFEELAPQVNAIVKSHSLAFIATLVERNNLRPMKTKAEIANLEMDTEAHKIFLDRLSELTAVSAKKLLPSYEEHLKLVNQFLDKTSGQSAVRVGGKILSELAPSGIPFA
jgi:hypothetical protein